MIIAVILCYLFSFVSTTADDDFQCAASDCFNLYKTILSSCDADGIAINEQYNDDNYQITFNLTGYSRDSLAVKTKQRVFSVSIQSGSKVFNWVQILPVPLLPRQSSCTMNKGILVCMFPYFTPLNNKMPVTCVYDDNLKENRVHVKIS